MEQKLMRLRHALAMPLYLFILATSVACTTGTAPAALDSPQDEASSDALSKANVTVGVFNIRMNQAYGRCLAATDSKLSNGSSVTLADCNNATTQLWKRRDGETTIFLGNDTCLDVTDGRNRNGAAVQLWSCAHGNDNQKWVVGDNGTLRWGTSNKCLDLTDGVTGQGARLQLWDCDINNKNQQWHLVNPIYQSVSTEYGTLLAELNTLPSAAIALPNTLPALGPAESQEILSLFNTYVCLDVHDIETRPFVQTYVCNHSTSQLFATSDAGRIEFPTKVVTVSDTSKIKARSHCLDVATADDTNTRIAALLPCDANSKTQTWSQQGNLIIHRDSRLCLALDAWGNTGARVPLLPCTESPTATWSLGDASATQASINAELQKQPVLAASKPWIRLVDRTMNPDGLDRLKSLYGSSADFIAWIQAAYAKNNAVAWSNASEPRNVKTLKVVIDHAPGIGWASHSTSANQELNLSTTGIKFFNPSDAPVKFKTDAIMHHELSHMAQWGYGLPSAFVEGFANWVTSKAGFIADSERSAGGSYQDGYSRTAFFLMWLDKAYPATGDDRRIFTQRMCAAARDAEFRYDKTWFGPWVLAQTGKNLDVLWSEYQATY
jgi:hypothetical protein